MGGLAHAKVTCQTQTLEMAEIVSEGTAARKANQSSVKLLKASELDQLAAKIAAGLDTIEIPEPVT